MLDHEADGVAVVRGVRGPVGDLPAPLTAGVDVLLGVGRGPVGNPVGDRHEHLEPGRVRPLDRVVVLGQEPLVHVAFAVRLEPGPVDTGADPADARLLQELDLAVDVGARLAPGDVGDDAHLSGLRGERERERGYCGGEQRGGTSCPLSPEAHDLRKIGRKGEYLDYRRKRPPKNSPSRKPCILATSTTSRSGGSQASAASQPSERRAAR